MNPSRKKKLLARSAVTDLGVYPLDGRPLSVIRCALCLGKWHVDRVGATFSRSRSESHWREILRMQESPFRRPTISSMENACCSADRGIVDPASAPRGFWSCQGWPVPQIRACNVPAPPLRLADSEKAFTNSLRSRNARVSASSSCMRCSSSLGSP